MKNMTIWVSRLLLVSYIGIIALLSSLRTDLSITKNEISQFLAGNYSWLAVSAFILLSAGSGLLARKAGENKNKKLAIILATYALSVGVAGLTGPDQVIHNVVSLVAFSVIPIGILMNETSNKSRYTWLSILIISLLFWPFLGFGVGERLTVLIEIAWLMKVSFEVNVLSKKKEIR